MRLKSALFAGLLLVWSWSFAFAGAVVMAPAPNGTDDTQVIQGLVDSVIAAGSGEIKFQAGTYKLSAPVWADGVKDGTGGLHSLKLSGARPFALSVGAPSATKILAIAQLEYLFGTNQEGFKMEGLHWDGANLAATGLLLEIRGSLVRDCRISNCTSRGVYMDLAYINKIERIQIDAPAGATGLYITGMTATTISDCHFRCGATSLRVHGTLVNVKGNTFSGPTDCAVDIVGDNTVVNVDDNYFEVAAGAAMLRVGQTWPGYTGTVSFQGNYCAHAGAPSDDNAVVRLVGNRAVNGRFGGNTVTPAAKYFIHSLNPYNRCMLTGPNFYHDPAYTLDTNSWTGFLHSVDYSGGIRP